MIISLVPAHGRDYRSKKAIINDLKAKKDFVIADVSCQYNGKPVNLADLKTQYSEIKVRYDDLRKSAIFDVKKELL